MGVAKEKQVHAHVATELFSKNISIGISVVLVHTRILYWWLDPILRLIHITIIIKLKYKY